MGLLSISVLTNVIPVFIGAGFRLKEIFNRIEKKNCKIYGEVNGGLRRNIKPRR